MILESSRLDVPRARSDRISRSSETDGSPASILATRDWLDLSIPARSTCERRCRLRRSRKLSASRILSSIYVDSSSESWRNSLALPIFQPFASNRFFFSSRIFVLPESFSTRRYYGPRRGPGFLAEDFQDHDSVGLDSVHDAPRNTSVIDAQLIAPRPDIWHRPRMGHGNQFAPLQPPKQIARLQSGSLREGRSLDLTVQPDKRFVVRAHWTQCMSDLICYQPGNLTWRFRPTLRHAQGG